MRRIFLLVIFATAIAIPAQAPPKAVLVDEFGSLQCEDILARADNYGVELSNNPASTGYIVISSKGDDQRYSGGNRKLLSAALQLRGFERDRFRFFRQNWDKSATQLWLVPPGSDLPNTDIAPFDEPKSDVSKPFQFGASDDANLCPTFVPRAFAQLILQNPGSTGKIEIAYGKASARDRWGFANDWIEEIADRQRVPRNRVKLVFAKDEAGLWASFWFIPAKKK